MYFDFAYEAAHTTTNYMGARGCHIIDRYFIYYVYLVTCSSRGAYSFRFNLASEFNPASIWIASYFRGRELVFSNDLKRDHT